MKINKILPILFILLSVSIAAVAQSGPSEPQGVRRFGLFVGVNDGGSTRQQLRWAVSDARKLSEVMSEVGGILPGDALVLEDPGTRSIASGFDRVNRLIEIEEANARRVEFVFYYSGHSDETGLLLGDDHMAYSDLREAIQSVNADVRVAILDSCASGAFTRSKGGERTQPFLIGDSSDMTGHAFLTSSSEDELAQESDRLAASYFTHFMISGLRGAADHSGDRKVTLNEAYEYAFNETLSVTSSSVAGPQHPSYNIELSGSGDLVLTDLSNPISSLVLDSDLAGRMFIKDGRGNIIAEVNKAPDKLIEIALDPGLYSVELNAANGGFYQYQFNLSYRSQRLLGMRDMNPIQPIANRTRGGSPIEPFLQNQDSASAENREVEDGTLDGPEEPAADIGGQELPDSSDSGEANDFFINEDDFFTDEEDFFSDESDFFDDPFFADEGEQPARDLVPGSENSSITDARPEQDKIPSNNSGLKREEPLSADPQQSPAFRYEPFYATVVPGISIPWGDGSGMHNNVAVSPLILETGMITGSAMSGIVSTHEGRVIGASFAGIGIEFRDNLVGAGFGGIYTIASGRVFGAQLAGVFNIASEPSVTFQAAGVFNIAEEPISGAQISGVFNEADHRIDGVQLSGVFNETGTVNGAQIAGVFNNAVQVNGAQLGTVNITKNGNGVQLGVVNLARGRLNGVQLGVINVADDLYGIPIGLISWVRQGIHDISYWTEDETTSFVGTANGSRNFYAILYAGIDNQGEFDLLPELTAGFGWGLRISLKPIYFDLEATVRRGTRGESANDRMVSLFDPENPYIYPTARFMTGLEFLGIGFFLGLSMDLELEQSLTGGLVRYNGKASGARPIEGFGTIHHRFMWGVRL